ncbi:MAG: hypothetical protein AAB463_00945 [Patescibacteria group bacterium]
MANQITHVALAEKKYDSLFSKFGKEDFFIGTVFPDIRYLGVIDRERTHNTNFLLPAILDGENTAFQAGVKYHCLVDAVREKFIIEQGLYALVPQSKYITQAIKCLEDEIYYPKVSDWAVYVAMLHKTLPEETAYGVASDDIARWHNLLADYFRKTPDDISREGLMMSIGFPKTVADEINTLVRQMRESGPVVGIIAQFWNNFDALLNE